jgi:hypothetical protein
MRLFIYGMESSGASTFCYFLGQRPGCVAVIDLWSHHIAPPLRVKTDIVLKATTTTQFRARDHVASFVPDRTIFFIRDPVAVYASLKGKQYADLVGTVEEKMARFDDEFSTNDFNVTLRYEDFIARDQRLLETVNGLGWPCTLECYNLRRSFDDILAANCAASPWLQTSYNRHWGFGNIHAGAISDSYTAKAYPADVVATVAKLSPNLSRHYGHAG